MRRGLALLLAALAVGLGVLLVQWQDPVVVTEPSPETAEVPQMVMTGLRQITTSTQGEWRSTLLADEALYFEAADRLELMLPHLWQQANGEEREMQSRRAVLHEGTRWELFEEVLLVSQPQTGQPALIHTDYLEYDTISDIAQTGLPVRVEQTDRLYTTAIGMTLNLSTQEFDLHEAVRTRLYPEAETE